MRALFTIVVTIAVAACGSDPSLSGPGGEHPSGGAGGTGGSGGTSGACNAAQDHRGTIPADTDPCATAAPWPHAMASDAVPVLVHYSRCEQEPTAMEVLGLVEQAWRFETGALGFSTPLADEGRCGPDGSYDVYLWPGAGEAYVQAIEANPATAHDDWFTFMVLDPEGPFGGDALDSTIAHELNHACQATDDWWEHIAAFEMTATFVEALARPDDYDWLFVLDDFQRHPDWSVDRDDGYETWFMYGSALLLHFVRERYFDGDASFAGAMWQASRNPPGVNKPDFADALDVLLPARANVSLSEAIGEFAAWRWYTGDRDDGMHFADGSLYPRPAAAATVTTFPASVPIDPMVFGSAYVDIQGSGDLSVALSSSAQVAWLVQAVPGTRGATADALDPTGDVVSLDGFAARTIVVTALPSVPRDPDDQTDERFEATLLLGQ